MSFVRALTRTLRRATPGPSPAYGLAPHVVPAARRWRRPALAVASLCLTAYAGTAVAGKPIRIVAFGDSLTAGYLLPDADGFAPKLQAALEAQGHAVDVINAGVSGDTTTGGLARLDWTFAEGADAAIVEFGANDMLRGIDPKIAEANLGKMLAALKTKHIKVLLAGMRATPSLGPSYAAAFDPIYPALAKTYDVPLYPFFLEGVLGDRQKHLSDQLHPNIAGVDTIVKNILPSVDALLRSVDPKS